MKRLWIAAIVALVTGSAVAAAPEAGVTHAWPQFRGPTGQGIAEAKGLPASWGEQENVVWKTPVTGKAWSSPVVWGDQVWVTNATEDARTLSVVCLDKNTGKVIRDDKLFDVPNPQYIIPFNSPASPTPVIEEGRIYITFGAPGTVCLDTKTGERLWERRDVQVNHYRGAGSSPVVYGNLLIMNFDGSDHQFVIALDKNTGKTVWQTPRSIDFQDLGGDGKPKDNGDWRKAFSTPRVATFDGKPILLSVGSKALYAYNPENGEEVWRVENRAAHSGSATPVIGQDLIYFSTGHGKTELWAVKPGGTGVVTDTHVAWKYNKTVPTRASVLLRDGLIYFIDDNGIISCVDAKTGEGVWKQRVDGKYSASPLYADGKIYFFSEEGHSIAIAPGREFKKLGEGQLPAGFMASPAVADNALFLRTKEAVYRIQNK